MITRSNIWPVPEKNTYKYGTPTIMHTYVTKQHIKIKATVLFLRKLEPKQAEKYAFHSRIKEFFLNGSVMILSSFFQWKIFSNGKKL